MDVLVALRAARLVPVVVLDDAADADVVDLCFELELEADRVDGGWVFDLEVAPDQPVGIKHKFGS